VVAREDMVLKANPLLRLLRLYDSMAFVIIVERRDTREEIAALVRLGVLRLTRASLSVEAKPKVRPQRMAAITLLGSVNAKARVGEMLRKSIRRAPTRHPHPRPPRLRPLPGPEVVRRMAMAKKEAPAITKDGVVQ
jgi:hypothetical protein